MREEVRLWLKQADADLKTAEKLGEDKVFYASVFFSQQAAEKYIKALWIFSNKELPPKTHNLVRMVKELKGTEELIDAAAELAPEYILTRYPTPEVALPEEIYTKTSAKRHYAAAVQIAQWVKSIIK